MATGRINQIADVPEETGNGRPNRRHTLHSTCSTLASTGAAPGKHPTRFPLRRINFDPRSREPIARREKPRKTPQPLARKRTLKTPSGARSAGPQSRAPRSARPSKGREGRAEQRSAGGRTPPRAPPRPRTRKPTLRIFSTAHFPTTHTWRDEAVGNPTLTVPRPAAPSPPLCPILNIAYGSV